MDALAELLDAYPLAAGWDGPNVTREAFELEGVSVDLVGMYSRSAEGDVTTAGAAGSDASTLARCYFELLERLAILAARDGGCGETLRVLGGEEGHLRRDAVFPPEVGSGTWRPSLSNGVAAHPELDEARDHAYLELVERDRVLRSWFGAAPAPRPSARRSRILDRLAGRFDVRIVRFEDPADPAEVHVLGAFLFPQDARDPFCCAFGAGHREEHALARAEGECLQRLGFLFGEDLPAAAPAGEPTPEFHLDYYLFPPHQARVRSWLSGSGAGGPARLALPERRASPTFVDLTPDWLASRAHVVRAIDEGRAPLGFGPGPPFVHGASAERRVHPIA